MINGTCKDCVYRDQTRCKRNPPTRTDSGSSKYPSVVEQDWCGQFQRAGDPLTELNPLGDQAVGMLCAELSELVDTLRALLPPSSGAGEVPQELEPVPVQIQVQESAPEQEQNQDAAEADLETVSTPNKKKSGKK